ncbi:MAG: hypothetical protein ACE5KU_05140 [Nitrososphaerales archaeon]
MVTREGPDGLERKYTAIYSAPVYRGIATGYAAGCCLRCIYCWSNWSRDFPEKFGSFYSPQGMAQKLFEAAKEGIKAPGWERFRDLKVNKLRVSGWEPTLGKEHLLRLLEYVEKSEYPFYLETNFQSYYSSFQTVDIDDVKVEKKPFQSYYSSFQTYLQEPLK